MKKRFNKYYIGFLSKEVQSKVLTTDELHIDVDSYKNVNLNTFSTLGVEYALDIPTLSGIFSHSKLITSNGVLKYDSLSELINDFLFEFNLDDDFDFEVDDDNDDSDDHEIEIDSDDRIGHFLEDGNFIIIKQNIKSKKYSLVDRDTIYNCFEQLMDKLENNSYNNSYESFDESKYVLDIERDELVKLLDEFQKTIEKHVVKDSCQVTVSAGGDNYYLFSLIKKDSKLEKHIVESGEILDEPNSRGFIFDGTYKDYVGFVLHSLKQGITLGCAVTTSITDFDVKDEKKIWNKCYGYIIGFKDNEIIINQLFANDVAKGYTFNLDDGKEVQSRRNMIYCGFKEDDIICGFDLEK